MRAKSASFTLILVLLAAGGAAAWYFGVRNSAVSSAAASAECEKHHLPRSACPFCDSSVVQKSAWCGEHGLPEALCWICHPALVAAYKAEGDWCAEHNLPESHCALCNPSVASKSPSSSDEGPSDVRLVSAPEPQRRVRAPNVECLTGKQRVQFRSADIAKQAGLEFASVAKRSISQTLECNAETDYNGNRYARIASRAAGLVRQVEKDLGDRVSAGESLAIVDSAELAAAKAESLQSAALVTLWEKNHARKHGLLEKGIVSEKDDLEAESKLAESQIALSRCKERLKSLGFVEAQIADLISRNDTSSVLTVTAPFGGVVVERTAVVGELVDTSKSLFAVADMSRIWAMLDVYEADAYKIHAGQPVVFAVDGLPGERFGGTVTWVSTRIDPKTRTLKARAEVDNSPGLLKANMFGRAQITVHDKEPLLVVPKTAVQWDGCCNLAFVRLSDVLYEPRKLRLGCDLGEHYEVKEGLAEADSVVTQGSYLLKTEIMKSSIGAGCCEAGAGKKSG